MDEKLLALPWQIQVALGGGYLAYLVAYGGIRQHHSASEAAFKSIAFGLVATGVLLWSPASPAALSEWRHPFWRPAIAILATVAAGAIWRWKGMGACSYAMQKLNIRWADDIPTAWLSVTAIRTDIRPSQITVDLNNGRTLVCDDTRRFRDAPYGPCVYGLDGSIALYVTAERKPEGQWIEHEDIQDIDGIRLTYVPASAINRVEMRLWTKVTEKAAKAAVQGKDVEAEAEATLAVLNQEYRPVSAP